MPSLFSLDYVYPSLRADTIDLIETSFEKEGRLTIQVYEQCYAVPARFLLNANGEKCLGGGLVYNGEWVKNSGLNIHSLTPYEFDDHDVEFINEDVIYIGIVSSIWGHAITDGIQHLWWFQTNEYLDHHRDKNIYYWGEQPITGNFLELLRLAGVDISKLKHITRNLLFKSVIVPDSSFVSQYPKGTHYFNDYVITINHIISQCVIPPKTDKMLFLSEPSSRRNCGIQQLEMLAKKKGYRVLHPKDLSVQEQISFLQGAEDVITFESSVGHNILFCKPNTRITILRKANYANTYQSVINKIRDFDVRIIDVHLSLMNNERFPYAGPFFVYANSLFCRFLNIPKQPFPWSLLKDYIRSNINDSEENLNAKLVIPNNYVQIISSELNNEFNRFHLKLSHAFSFLPFSESFKKRVIKRLMRVRIKQIV